MRGQGHVARTSALLLLMLVLVLLVLLAKSTWETGEEIVPLTYIVPSAMFRNHL